MLFKKLVDRPSWFAYFSDPDSQYDHLTHHLSKGFMQSMAKCLQLSLTALKESNCKRLQLPENTLYHKSNISANLWSWITLLANYLINFQQRCAVKICLRLHVTREGNFEKEAELLEMIAICLSASPQKSPSQIRWSPNPPIGSMPEAVGANSLSAHHH